MVEHNAVSRWMQVVTFLVALAVSAGSALAQQGRAVKQMTVLSTAIVHADNQATGRQNAVEDALAAAVGRVVLEMLAEDTVVQRFKVINDGILEKRKRYIQNYRVLTESVSGNTIRTLVQVDVSTERIRRDLRRLGVALSGAVYPRVVLMMAEKNVDSGAFTYWWGESLDAAPTACGTAMAESLEQMGYAVIEPPGLDAPLGLSPMLTEAQMVSLARRLGADVVIAGTCTAGVAANTMGGSISAFEATVDARALTVKGGKPLGKIRQKFAVSGEDMYAGGREALGGAGKQAAESLSRDIMSAWQQRQEKRAEIEVLVEGTGGHIASFVRLRTAISTLSGVQELRMREMSADLAVLAVKYQGSARSLADALLLKTFKGFGIDIYAVSGNTISIRLIHD